MTTTIPKLKEYSPYLFSMAIGTCLASKRSPIFLGLSPHAVALNTAVAMGLDYFCKNNIKMVDRLALTIFCGILASKGVSRLSKKFDMSTGKSLLASSLQFGALNQHLFFPTPEKPMDRQTLNDRLCKAAASGNVKKVKRLVTHLQSGNLDDLNEALQLAVLFKHAGVVEALRDYPLFKQIPANGNNGLGDVLRRAASIGDAGVIKALEGCSQFKEISHGSLQDASRIAKQNGHQEALKLIQEYLSKR